MFKNELSNLTVLQDLRKRTGKLIPVLVSKKTISLTDWPDKRVKEMRRSLKSHNDVTRLGFFTVFNFSKCCACYIIQIVSYLNLMKSINNSGFN